MVLKTDSLKRLHHIYFGKKMSNPNEYKNLDRQLRFKEKDAADLPGHAYTPSGTWNTAEPALQYYIQIEIHLQNWNMKRIRL